MLGGADNPNDELPSYITGADIVTCSFNIAHTCATRNTQHFPVAVLPAPDTYHSTGAGLQAFQWYYATC